MSSRGSFRARPQQPEHVRRRRLRGPPLQQRDEHGHSGHRLAQVVRHHVGVAAQVRLHPPLLGHVGKEHHQSVAELHDALDEGAEHVAVAERRVVGHLSDPGGARVADLDIRAKGPAPAHPRQRLQQRVAIPRGGREPEGTQHGRIAVAEREVGDPPLRVPPRPEDSHRLRERVEQRPKAGGALLAEERHQLRVLAPDLLVRQAVLTTPIRCPSGSLKRPISIDSITVSGPMTLVPPRLSALASAASTSGTPT